MRATSFDGTQIRFETEGPADAPALLLSNSLGTSLDMWEPQRPLLAGRFRLIRYDVRGHGASDVPSGPYSIDMLGRDALAVMDAAGAERAHVVGLSMGGMIGVWLAANHPERAMRIALCNTTVFMPNKDLWNERIRIVREKGMAAIADATMERWFTKAFRDAKPEAVAAVKAVFLAHDPEGYAGCCAAIRDMDQRDALARIGAPILVVAGRHDQATTPAQAEEIQAGIAGSRLEILEAAHLSNIEAQEDYDRIVLGFLTA